MPRRSSIPSTRQTLFEDISTSLGKRSSSLEWRLTGDIERDSAFLTAIHVLRSVKGFGPAKFKKLYESGIPIADVLQNPSMLGITGMNIKAIRRYLAGPSADQVEEIKERVLRQFKLAQKFQVSILSYGNQEYSRLLYSSNLPVPLLYARGSLGVLRIEDSVACVGTRKIRPPYSRLHAEFVSQACEKGFCIVAGFALGADSIGHLQALDCGGATLCVMPNGLDRPFPPENKELWHRVIHSPGALAVSEFPLGMMASSLSLRKRNKLIIALSKGVLISQTGNQGGSMNAYRAALEQHKPIATFDASGDTAKDIDGNRSIAADTKADVTVFPKGESRKEAYDQWLERLSSST